MPRLIKKRSKKSGLLPGTLVHIGEKRDKDVKIFVIDYDEANVLETELKAIEECIPLKEKPTVTWINLATASLCIRSSLRIS